MNRNILFIALMIGLSLAMCQQAAFGDVSANEQDAAVTITITKLQVNDQNLELGWKIVNHSDHDVWILDKFHLFEPSFEVYLAEDDQTLLIRRRLNVPVFGVWFATPGGRYVRMHPGEERLESLSLDIPISVSWLFPGGEWSTLSSAVIKRIQLEIGYYDEDLPELIHGILAEGEKYNPKVSYDRRGVVANYFPGFLVYFDFEGLAGFERIYENGSDEISVLYSYQALKDEMVLRVTVDGVDIPYGEVPAEDEPPQSETEPAGVTMVLTGFDVNDTNLELSWKIINNTDHDVWICESMSRDYPPPLFEQFLDEDAKTLVIRKLFDLPMSWYEYPPIGSRYVRLRPGEVKVESVSVDLPVRPYRMSVSNKVTNAEYAECLALEIGFYDEDLPALILQIVELAEFLNCDLLAGLGENVELGTRFFGGRQIAQYYYHIIGFGPNIRSADADGEMWMPHFYKVRMGEKVLRIEVDGVSIPYKSNYPPLAGREGKSNENQQSQQVSSRNKDKPEREKG